VINRAAGLLSRDLNSINVSIIIIIISLKSNFLSSWNNWKIADLVLSNNHSLAQYSSNDLKKNNSKLYIYSMNYFFIMYQYHWRNVHEINLHLRFNWGLYNTVLIMILLFHSSGLQILWILRVLLMHVIYTNNKFIDFFIEI
jgi:hypothetical protein